MSFVFSGVQAVHRQVTGFCAAGGEDFTQMRRVTQFLAMRDRSAAEVAEFCDCDGSVNIV